MDFWNKLDILLEYKIYTVSIKRLLLSVLIILLSIVMRKFFVNVIIRVLKKLTNKTKNNLDDQLIYAVEMPVRMLIIAIGIWLALWQLQVPQGIKIFIHRLMVSILWYTVFWTAYRASDTLSLIFKRLTERTDIKLNNMLYPFLSKALKVLIMILGAVTIIQVWGADITGLITGLGLGGLAFALAAKDTAANLFGSITLMLDRPFEIGDWIMTSNVEGTVEEIGFRSTRIRTFSQAVVTVPNAIMSNETITNWSKMGKRRITFKLGLTYSADSSHMKECVKRIRQMLESHKEVHTETIFVYFEGFGDSALEIFLYFFTKTTNWQKFLEVREDINLKIMDIIEDMKLSIAYPSTSIYIESADDKAVDKILNNN